MNANNNTDQDVPMNQAEQETSHNGHQQHHAGLLRPLPLIALVQQQGQAGVGEIARQGEAEAADEGVYCDCLLYTSDAADE